MVPCGGLWFEMSFRPILEMSLPVTRVVLFPFYARSRRDIELPVSELGGKPYGVALVTIFHPSVWVVCMPQGNIIV